MSSIRYGAAKKHGKSSVDVTFRQRAGGCSYCARRGAGQGLLSRSPSKWPRGAWSASFLRAVRLRTRASGRLASRSGIVAEGKLDQADSSTVVIRLRKPVFPEKGPSMIMRFGIAIVMFVAFTFCGPSLGHQANAETIKGESKDRKMSGTQPHGGGGGAGVTSAKPKKKMLNPQPEPPGRR